MCTCQLLHARMSFHHHHAKHHVHSLPLQCGEILNGGGGGWGSPEWEQTWYGTPYGGLGAVGTGVGAFGFAEHHRLTTPEPSTLILLSTGLAAVILIHRWKRRLTPKS